MSEQPVVVVAGAPVVIPMGPAGVGVAKVENINGQLKFTYTDGRVEVVSAQLSEGANPVDWASYYTKEQTDALLTDFLPKADVPNIINQSAPVEHNHVIGDVAGLRLALDDKAPLEHTHPAPDLSNYALAADMSTLATTVGSVQSQLASRIINPSPKNEGDTLEYNGSDWVAKPGGAAAPTVLTWHTDMLGEGNGFGWVNDLGYAVKLTRMRFCAHVPSNNVPAPCTLTAGAATHPLTVTSATHLEEPPNLVVAPGETMKLVVGDGPLSSHFTQVTITSYLHKV